VAGRGGRRVPNDPSRFSMDEWELLVTLLGLAPLDLGGGPLFRRIGHALPLVRAMLRVSDSAAYWKLGRKGLWRLYRWVVDAFKAGDWW